MTTPLHDSIVQHYVDMGYRTQGFIEFCRLAYFLQDDLMLDARTELVSLFASDKKINVHSATRIAEAARRSLNDGDSITPYRDCRLENPAPRLRPDAWAVIESPECPGYLSVVIIEAFDTCRTEFEKIAEYGQIFDHYSKIQFDVFEVGANDGSIARHDPLHAFTLLLHHEVSTGSKGVKIPSSVKLAYRDHINSGKITVKREMMAG